MLDSKKTIDDYIKFAPIESRKALASIREAIRRVAPDAEEGFSYGVPAFKLNGNLVLFAGFAHHIGFYPQPSALLQFKEQLSGYQVSKGAVRFPLDKPLPIGLIEKMVIFRIKENLARNK